MLRKSAIYDRRTKTNKGVVKKAIELRSVINKDHSRALINK